MVLNISAKVLSKIVLEVAKMVWKEGIYIHCYLDDWLMKNYIKHLLKSQSQFTVNLTIHTGSLYCMIYDFRQKKHFLHRNQVWEKIWKQHLATTVALTIRLHSSHSHKSQAPLALHTVATYKISGKSGNRKGPVMILKEGVKLTFSWVHPMSRSPILMVSYQVDGLIQALRESCGGAETEKETYFGNSLPYRQPRFCNGRSFMRPMSNS